MKVVHLKADIHSCRKLVFFLLLFSILFFFMYLVHYLTQQCREVVTCVSLGQMLFHSITFLYLMTESVCSSCGYYLCNFLRFLFCSL